MSKIKLKEKPKTRTTLDKNSPHISKILILRRAYAPTNHKWMTNKYTLIPLGMCRRVVRQWIICITM